MDGWDWNLCRHLLYKLRSAVLKIIVKIVCNNLLTSNLKQGARWQVSPMFRVCLCHSEILCHRSIRDSRSNPLLDPSTPQIPLSWVSCRLGWLVGPITGDLLIIIFVPGHHFFIFLFPGVISSKSNRAGVWCSTYMQRITLGGSKLWLLLVCQLACVNH